MAGNKRKWASDDDPLLGNDFPKPPHEHGMEAVTISVGGSNSREVSLPKREFLVHRDLLIRSSRVFEGMLQKSFIEGTTNHIELAEACPAAFEVLYHALYSGRIADADFYNRKSSYSDVVRRAVLPEDVLWLRTFELAHYLVVDKLLSAMYAKIRVLFNSHDCRLPSPLLVRELFGSNGGKSIIRPVDMDNDLVEGDDGGGSACLEDYIVKHTAYCIHENRRIEAWDASDGKRVLAQDRRFAAAVAARLVDYHCESSGTSRTHPNDIPRFGLDVFVSRICGTHSVGQVPDGQEAGEHEEE